MLRTLPIYAAVICGLLLRAFIPAGYMPASAGSGLLFELCPDQLPVGVTFAEAGHDHHAHHHDAEQAAGDTCDVGHMLASAWIDAPISDLPIAASGIGYSDPTIPQSADIAARRIYSPRAPPVS